MDAKAANVLYHDRAASEYDDKWSIDFDDRTLAYVEERLAGVMPEKVVFERALEIGAGTGFFLLNLYRGGWVKEGAATDISPGILEVCARNAAGLGWEIETEVADAEALPFPDESFDLVCGHAFLHHIPDPALCLREMARVCRPGGTVLVAGEPTKGGHVVAEAVKKTVGYGLRALRRVPGLGAGWKKRAKSAEEAELSALESVVDLWEFEPERVAGMAEGAGLVNVRYVTEELLASVFGWTCRVIEGNAPAGLLGERWAWFAYTNYLRLSRLDAKVMSRIVPARWFYNIVLAGEKPA